MWDASDPIDHGWFSGVATIYKETCSITHVANADGEQSQVKGTCKAAYMYYVTGLANCLFLLAFPLKSKKLV